jgi:ATP-dependent Clp protease ATP-binding subunit ClpC
MSGHRSESDLVTLRKLARETAQTRGETPTSVHLLAAVWSCGGPAHGLLDQRRLDDSALLKAARALDEHVDDAISTALSTARDVAHRTAVPARESFPSSRGGAVRPAAADEPSGIHVLVVLLSNRRYAAYRALAQCGVDIARLRSAATRIALGLVARPRDRKASSEVAQLNRGAARRATTAVEVPLISRERKLKLKKTHSQPPPAMVEKVPESDVEPVPPPVASEPKPVSEAVPDVRAPLGPFDLDPERFPTLAAVGRNLTLAAHRGELETVIGREPEVEQALDILAKRHANNPVLIGPAGVGKTSVARAVAMQFAQANDEPRLLIEIPVTELLAGTGARGALSERLAAIRLEVCAADGRVVLFIDEIQELLASGAAEEALAELKVALGRGVLPMIATATNQDYRRHIEADPALARRFSVVEVVEPNEAEAFLLLRTVARSLAAHHGVRYSDEAIAVSVAWSIRFVPGRALPDKAVSILDLAGARLRRRQADGAAEVMPEHVAEIVSELAEVPLDRLLETDRERMINMSELLAERVVGHDEACARIASVLRRNAAGLGTARPVGSFLLLGPTGVGKTETAKAVAHILFGAADAMTRLDMSEYAESHSVARIIGAPPGYVGHEAGGLLTESVRKRPYQVLLLDEIEKAHRDVLQTFLQVFDEGRLTDGRGRTVDFTHTVIMLTSNIGSAELHAAMNERRVGFNSSSKPTRRDLNDVAVKAARAALPPELYNRLDDVIYYKHLEREDVRAIAVLLLNGLAKSLHARGITLDVDGAAIEVLMDRGGYDIDFGARPMRRAISRLVEAPIADLILAGELEDGSVVMLAVDDGELVVDSLRKRKQSRKRRARAS